MAKAKKASKRSNKARQESHRDLTIFEFDDYKTFLREANRCSEHRGFRTRLSEAAGCSRSYLSQVLNGSLHFTPDQALLIGTFLDLGDEALNYFLALVLRSRSSSRPLELHYDKQIKEIRQRARTLRNAVASQLPLAMTPENQQFYFSSWQVAVIHTMTSCVGLQTVEAIAEHLRLERSEVSRILKLLEDMHLVRAEKGKFIHSGRGFHLGTNSAFTTLNHANWRMRSLQGVLNESEIHYSSVFSVSQKDYDILKEKLLRFLREQRDSIVQSPGEVPVAFLCDLFRC